MDLEVLRKRASAIGEPLQELLLTDIIRRIRGAGAITSTAEYQIYRVQQLGLAEEYVKVAIAESLNLSDTAIDMLFEDMANETVAFEQNEELQQLVTSYVNISKEGVRTNFENLWAAAPDKKLYTIKEAYAKVMDFAFMQTVSGALDYQTAISRASKELFARGVRSIPNKDDTRSYRVEYAARNYVINKLGAMHNDISQMNYDKLGANAWEISAHEAPAEDHAPYQGRQYTNDEFNEWNNALERKIGWWWCAHIKFAIFMGESIPAYTDAELQKFLDDNEKGVTYDGKHYTLRQAKDRKRQLEALISQKKYDVIAAEGNAEMLKTQQIRLTNIRREYETFCKGTNQTPENWRTMVALYGHSEASKTAWAVRKLGFADINGETLYAVDDNIIANAPKPFFDALSNNMNTKAQSYAKQILTDVKDKLPGTEAAITFSIDGKQINHVIGTDNNMRVAIKNLDTPFILLHNHASNGMLSPTDIENFIFSDKMIGIGAIGNHGALSIAEKSYGFDKTKAYDLLIEKIQEKTFLTLKQAEDVMKEYANEVKQYGIIFK